MATNEGGADNPFSFKSFVKRTGADGGAKTGGKKEGGRKSKCSAAPQDGGGVPFPEEGSVCDARGPHGGHGSVSQVERTLSRSSSL